MKIVENFGAQGDVVFRRIAALPSGAERQSRKAGEPLVVTHSETGHHHIMSNPEVECFAAGDPLVSYLRLTGDAEVEHLRPYDTHETLRLGAGYWEVRRQREHTPEGWRRVED